jgi:tetratricopeptide (TPR) repeat protein
VTRGPAILLGLLLLLPGLATGAELPGYVGSAICQGCHEAAWRAWRESHHYRAMLPATEETVLGDFADSRFEYAGLTHRFFRRDGKYYVATDNAAGALDEFEIAYTFGFQPLQQYLIGFPDGRFQALNIVWDSRPESEGGQRWYHLYPDERVTHEDLLHWTGSFQNWNSRCAACHSTGLEKNYDPATNRYATQWAEVNVACEACHGPGRAHSDWAAGDRSLADPGFANALPAAGTWSPQPDRPTFERTGGEAGEAPAGVCATCHARRAELAPFEPGAPFSDLYQLRLLEDGLYHPDGQILDEVYVLGSFLQSRMHQAGVSCSDCHEPHSGAPRAAGNDLCARCHRPEVFDRAAHHHHPAGSSGAACVNCHMPATTYMGVDARRDHSFRVPEPRLSVELGIPNACNRCHLDRAAEWAATHLAAWYPGARLRADHAPVLAAARANQPAALPGLLAIAADPGRSGILRATALRESGRFPSNETLAAAAAGLRDTDPLVRVGTVRALEAWPATQRYALLQPLISDPARSVRIAVAAQLADVPADRLPAPDRAELNRLRAEYLDSLRLNADMPEDRLNLGIFLVRSGLPEAAESAYRQALALAPGFVPAMINLADLYRASGLDHAAEPLLQDAIRRAPDQAPAYHALGLLRVRQSQHAAAVELLGKAAELDPDNPRYAYVHGVALYELGRHNAAIAALEEALQRHPGNAELTAALAAYYRQQGEEEKLRQLESQAD